MGDYATMYYNLTGRARVKAGDVTARVALRDSLECKPFGWYVPTSAAVGRNWRCGVLAEAEACLAFAAALGWMPLALRRAGTGRVCAV